MELIIRHYKLKLRHTFTISRQSYNFQDNLIVELKDNKISGYGEATSNPYYKITVPLMMNDLEILKPLINSTVDDSPEIFWAKM